jgi:hypothetical protein
MYAKQIGADWNTANRLFVFDSNLANGLTQDDMGRRETSTRYPHHLSATMIFKSIG